MTAAGVPATDDSGRGAVCDPYCMGPPHHPTCPSANPARPGTADPTEPPATVEQLRDLIRENQRLRGVEQRVRELAESAKRNRSAGDHNGSMTPAGFVRVEELLHALGGGDDA